MGTISAFGVTERAWRPGRKALPSVPEAIVPGRAGRSGEAGHQPIGASSIARNDASPTRVTNTAPV